MISIKTFCNFLSRAGRWVPALGLALMLGACSILDQVSPYRMEIQQGNMVNQEMVSKLTPGMTKDQVRFILGSPLIVDPFRVDRWDYIFMRQPENRNEVEKRRVVVFFENDKLSRIEGDVVPAGDSKGATPRASTR
jgi:outer membrane protein assembly factor BamE